MKTWNKFTAWIKRLGWIKVLSIIAAGATFAYVGQKASNARDRAKKAEDEAEVLLFDQTKENVQKAVKKQQQANKHTEQAQQAKDKAEQLLVKIGADNETLDDIANRFNSKRPRMHDSTPSI